MGTCNRPLCIRRVLLQARSLEGRMTPDGRAFRSCPYRAYFLDPDSTPMKPPTRRQAPTIA